MNLTRRSTLALAAAASVASLAGWSPAFAKEGDHIDLVKLMAPTGLPDKILGNSEAKVTVIEYASPTCPHCALFANEVLPAFKEKYIDSGEVKFVIRPFMRNVLDGAVFLLAEAAAKATDDGMMAAPPADAPSAEAMSADAPSAEAMSSSMEPAVPLAEGEYSQAAIEAYHNVVATYFRTQTTWGVSDKPRDAILAVAKQLGFTDESFDAALTNQDLFAAMEKLRDQALNEFGLEGTPTFYVNGKQLTGEKTLEQLAAEIDPLLA